MDEKEDCDYSKDFAEQVERGIKEAEQEREEAKRRGRKIEAGILRFCKDNGLNLETDPVNLAMPDFEVPDGLADWRDALVLNEIEIYGPGREFDLVGFLSGVEFQSDWIQEIWQDAWHLARKGGWCAEGYVENPTFLIPEAMLFGHPTEWPKYKERNGQKALERLGRDLRRKQFLWSLILHFWKQTAETGAGSEPIEQAGPEETPEILLPEESKPARKRPHHAKPDKAVLLSQVEELGTAAAVQRKYYPSVSRAQVHRWIVDYEIELKEAREAKSDRTQKRTQAYTAKK